MERNVYEPDEKLPPQLYSGPLWKVVLGHPFQLAGGPSLYSRLFVPRYYRIKGKIWKTRTFHFHIGLMIFGYSFPVLAVKHLDRVGETFEPNYWMVYICGFIQIILGLVWAPEPKTVHIVDLDEKGAGRGEDTV